MNPIRVAVLSTEGFGYGGAIRATRRLATGLRKRGHEVGLLSLDTHRCPGGTSIAACPSDPNHPDVALEANRILQEAYFAPRRTALSNTFFSAEVAGYSFADSPLLDHFDLVNIHWAAGLVAPHTLAEMLRQGRTVVLTLHDMAAFTGGCHYSAGCRRYQDLCTPCPQLQDDPLDLTRWTLAKKRDRTQEGRLAVISPSRWLAECAKDSGVFAADRVFTIPNALETDVFRPTEKRLAKTLLGIDPDVKTLLFGAESSRERRKGFDLLLAMWNRLKVDPSIADLLRQQRLRILIFGEKSAEMTALGGALLDLGRVRNDSRLALIYSAADVTILASREDNLPNILLESMACGTPVVAFKVGGIPDVIDHRVDGWMVPPFDTVALGDAVAGLLRDEAAASKLGQAARKKIDAHYSLDIQARAYERLFARLLDEIPRHAASAHIAPPPTSTVLPLTLNPDVAASPIGLYLEQQQLIAALQRDNDQARNQLRRMGEILETALHEILASRSWRYTHRLRGRRREPLRTGTPEESAVTLLTLVRSKSWELTGPLRLLLRLAAAGPRFSKRFRKNEKYRTAAPPLIAAPEGAVDPEHLTPTGSEVPSEPRAHLDVICLHLFHRDLWPEFAEELRPLIGPQRPLYVTLPQENADFSETIQRDIGSEYSTVVVLENRGLDIYPFLFLFDHFAAERAKPRTLTKLHTKKSAHHSREFAESWRKDLYQPLLRQHAAITERFRDRELALVCSKKWWVSEDETSENFQTEQRAIEEVCGIFGVSPTYHYLTGSMYVVSFDYLDKLFAGVDRQHFLSQFPPGYQRSSTLAHGFERVICYGIEKYGLKLNLV